MVGDDVPDGAVEQAGDAPVRRVFRDVRPVRREDVVGAPSEQQFERMLEHAAHYLAVGIGPHPAAVGEAVAGVSLLAAGACITPSRLMNAGTMSLRMPVLLCGSMCPPCHGDGRRVAGSTTATGDEDDQACCRCARLIASVPFLPRRSAPR